MGGPLKLRSLYTRVSAAILATAVLLVAWQVAWTRRTELREIRESALAEVRQDMLSLQTNLDFALAAGAVEQVNRELTARGADPDVEVLVLLDEAGVVVGSRLRHEVGGPGEAAWGGPLPRDQMETASSRRAGSVRLTSDGAHVVAAYPVVLGAAAGELGARRIGLVLARYGLERPFAAVQAHVVRRGLEQLAAALIGVGALLLFGRYSVARRVRGLVAATERFAAGQLDTRAGVSGDDEIAAIGAAFDAMAARVAEARRQLLESEARFRTLVEAAPVGILLTAPGGGVVARNAVWRERMPDGPDWTRALHEEDRARVGRAWAEAQAERRSVREEGRVVGADGRVAWIQLLGVPQLGQGGELSGFVTIAVDLTERREAEEARARLEARLAQAEKLEAIGTLASGVAHDFNNVLAAILGHASLLAEVPELRGTPAATRHVEPLTRAAQRGRALVRELLAFGRPGLQKPRSVEVGALVEEVAQFLRPSLPPSVLLSLVLQPGTPPVFADPDQLHRLLVNLGTNAWQAMRGAGGTLTIAVDRLEIDAERARAFPGLRVGPTVRIRVRDEGVGMDAATRARAFEPFFSTKPGEGTGLGLAVVHGIVRAHGGAVAVESEPGRGTTVSVCLPAAPAIVGREAPPTPPAAPAAPAAPHVLYVDDDEDLLELARHALVRLGFRVTTVATPAAALAAFRAEPDAFDLVLTDQRMPGMLGEDLAAAVLGIRPDAHVVVVSGHVAPEDEARIRGRGVRAVVEKPMTADELAALCRRALAERVG